MLTIYNKIGGGTSSLVGGGLKTYIKGIVSPTYDPTDWLTSTFRAIKAYIEREFDPRAWEIQFSFPSSADLAERMPLVRSIIHFEIDNIDNPFFGFGENIVNQEYDPFLGTEIPIEAQVHTVNFDVGIWTSAKSGGVTSRLEAYQRIVDLFNGPSARDVFRTVTGGIEVLSFSGGQFLKEEINDIDVFRVANITLVIRVYSLHHQQTVPLIQEIIIVPELIIRDEIIVTE